MFEIQYISSSCNKIPHILDWGRNNLICYAANHAISIYDPHVAKIGTVLSTLHAHNNRVNVVRWIRFSTLKPETEFISASSDGSVIIWTMVGRESGSFQPSHILMHNEPVNLCDAIHHPTNELELLICTCTVNGILQIWYKDHIGSLDKIQSLETEAKLKTEVRLLRLPSQEQTSLLLLIALEDSSLCLYSSECIYHTTDRKKIGDFTKKIFLHGHGNWIKCIDYIHPSPKNLLIATGSQDGSVRLWKITNLPIESQESDSSDVGPTRLKFNVNNQNYNVILESILNGHEAWVHGVHWHPMVSIDDNNYQPMKLLSCSLDKSIIIWEPDTNTGIWSETVRVGGVGGSSLGFYGCKFSPNGNHIVAHDYHGSFHMWHYIEKTLTWERRPAPSGHHDKVVDICWDQRGRFLLSTSTDKTTRIHTSWRQENGKELWHEVARPQIHGYDMTSVAILKPHIYASGAEEKVVRIFTAPLIFKNYLEALLYDVNDFNDSAMAQEASVPILGLTNKAKSFTQRFEERKNTDTDHEDPIDMKFDQIPTEDDLIRHTLWPELQKLYGHAHEIFSMAARADGKLLATSSRASSSEHAVILLWDTLTWSQKQKLYSHQLTVTQLAFSPNNKYLLSVSRDRQWSLFIVRNESYELLLSTTREECFHARIIWCCAWTIDSNYFGTGSRDGKIGIWSSDHDVNQKLLPRVKWQAGDLSVTALAFAPVRCQENFNYIIAIGYESGCIDLKKIERKIDGVGYNWIHLSSLNTSSAHHATVKKLAFRPNREEGKKHSLELASCSSDWSVKIVSFFVDSATYTID